MDNPIRYIRMNVNHDVVDAKRLKAPLGGEDRTAMVLNCCEDEIETAERKYKTAEAKVVEAKQARQVFVDMTEGRVKPQGMSKLYKEL